MAKIFIGVAWPYVNGDIHPGHIAGNFLPADIFSRFQRYIGNKVLMVSGSDCYGTPITVEADKRGKTPEQIVAEYHPHHLELFKTYGIDFDLYTQTTTANHAKTTQDLLINLAKNGYITKNQTKQYFSPEENKFLPDRYVEGECGYCGFKEARGDQCDNCGRVLDFTELKHPVNKLSKKPLTLKETEHLFFNWPALQGFLEKYVSSHQQDWKTWIYNEVAGWLKKGLKPRPITRDINWGVEIPNSQLPKALQLSDIENKRIYVWFEAVIGYLSAAQEYGKNWQEFWYPKDKNDIVMYNFMGKDNVVFHALFWPGQLYGAYSNKIKLPDVIAANQYLNLEGKKFSKSRGVTIDSVYLAKTYGADPVRFYLAYIMPESADADFSWSDFVDVTNNNLIGSFGNFVNRVLTLVQRHSYGKKLDDPDQKIKTTILQIFNNAKANLNNLDFKLYAYSLLELATIGNKYIDKHKPWDSSSPDSQRKKILANCLLVVLALQALTKPLLPRTYEKLAKMTGVTFDQWPDFKELATKLAQVALKNIGPLFAKIDPEIVEKERSKISL